MAYTILWIDDEGKDRWDRFERAKHVADYLKEYGLEESEDITIIIHAPEECDAPTFLRMHDV